MFEQAAYVDVWVGFISSIYIHTTCRFHKFCPVWWVAMLGDHRMLLCFLPMFSGWPRWVTIRGPCIFASWILLGGRPLG